MKPSTKEQALRFAAKVALGAAVTGCGGGTANVAIVHVDAAGADDGGSSLEDASAPRDSAVDAVVTTDAGPTCALTSDADGGLAPSAIDCCLSITTASAPPAGTATPDGGPFASSSGLVSCCKALAASAPLTTYVYGPKNWPTAACMACAEVLGDRLACTPWGPPMPPAMPEVA
jgi:hypothetical protein